MGTTLVALRVDRINKMAYFIKIGDSRIKAVNSEIAVNIGIDHSNEMEYAKVYSKNKNEIPVPELLRDEDIEFYENLVRQEAPAIAGKNVITSCLGRESALQITYLEIPIEEIGPQEEPTTLLLYSDGAIRGSMTEAIITEEARNGGTPEQIAKNIVSRALASGSPDNVTVSAVKMPYRLMFDEAEIKTFKTDKNGNLVREKNEPQAPAAPEPALAPAPAVSEPAPEPTPATPELTGKSYIHRIKVAGRLFGKKDITVIFQCYGSQQIDENIRQAIAEAAAKTAKSSNVSIYFSNNMDLAKIISPTNANKFLQAVKELIALKAKKQSAQDIYIYLQKIENKLHLSVEFNEIPPEAAQYFQSSL
jgi:hypothetical protein